MKKLIIVIVIISVVGGLGYMATQSQGKFEHDSLIEHIHHAEKERLYGHALDSSWTQVLNDLDTADFLKVHSSDPKIKSFFTQFRTDDIISFPCQSCHNVPLDQMKRADGQQKNSHWNIEMQHASSATMGCTTCHSKDNMNYLTSLNGEQIDMDRSFELCSQCHNAQYQDWLGGAHGKSISGWRPPRVVKTCVNCHDPHQPAIESRWPSRLVSEDKPH